MGWSSGSALMLDVIKNIQPVIKDDKTRKRLYSKLIVAFQWHDADTLEEACGLDKAYDKAFKEAYPKDDPDMD